MRKIYIVLIGVVVAILVGLFVQTVAIYSFGSEGVWTQHVVKIIPYPVASVGGSYIRISDYWENVRSQRQYYETQDFSEYDREIDFTSDQGRLQLLELKRVVLLRMIDDTLMRRQAQRFQIEVSEQEARDEVENQIAKVGNRDVITRNIDRLFGWTLEDFAQRFVRSQLFRQKLEVAVLDDDDVQSAAQRKAEDIYVQLRHGADFAALARQHSDDPSTKDEGGDLGILRRDESSLASGSFDKVLFEDLGEGEYSGVLRSSIGFHILKVVERLSDTEVKASHIVVGLLGLDEWLDRENRDVRVNILIDGYQWNSDSLEVEFTNPDFRGIRDLFYENVTFPSIEDFAH